MHDLSLKERVLAAGRANLNRRRLLGLGAASLAGAVAARPGLTWAQDATPSASLPNFTGETLNFMIIQPHAVTGSAFFPFGRAVRVDGGFCARRLHSLRRRQ